MTGKRAIPVVVVTAHALADRGAQELGAVAARTKPRDMDDLVQLVQTHARRRG